MYIPRGIKEVGVVFVIDIDGNYQWETSCKEEMYPSLDYNFFW